MILKEKMKFAILFQSCFVLLFLIQVMYACGPAEEGKPYTLTHVMAKAPSDTTMLMWTKDDILVAECPLVAGDCITNDINWLIAKVEKNDETFIFTIDISRVSRELQSNAKGFWKLKTHSSSPRVEVLYYCNLQVYAKPTETNCMKTWSEDGVTVSCYGRHVYPEAKMTLFKEYIDANTVSCKNTFDKLEPIYYKTDCVLTIKRHELHLGKQNFIFCIFPTLIGQQNYTQIGTNVSLSLLIEYSSVSVQDCQRTDDFINCRCSRLDSDDSESSFNWIVDGVDVENTSRIYTTIVNGTEVKDVTCTPITTKKCPIMYTECTDTGNIAVILLALLFIASGLVNFILCYTYIKKCQPARDFSQSILKKVYLSSERKQSKGIELTANEESQKFLENETGESTRYTGKVEDISAVSSVAKFDAKTYNVKCSILLVGTKGSNKDLYKRTLLRMSYCIEKNKVLEQKIWQVFDSETNELLHETSTDKVKLPDKNTLHLHYFKRGDTVFKLVDGPVFDRDDVNFDEEMKSSLVLSREGFNAVVVVYTNEKEKEVRTLINILNKDFGFNMNNLILVKSNDARYKTYVAPKKMNIKKGETQYEKTDATHLRDKSKIKTKKQKDITQTKDDLSFKKWFGDRCIQFGILADSIDNSKLFSLVCGMDKAIAVPLFVDDGETFDINKILENVLIKLSLLMEIISKRTNEYQSETGQILTMLQDTWQNYLDGKYEKAQSNEETEMQRGLNCEDVTYLINCLQTVYFGPLKVERNEGILLPHVKHYFQKFNDWYVKRLIRDKDRILDSNLKMKLSVR